MVQHFNNYDQMENKSRLHSAAKLDRPVYAGISYHTVVTLCTVVKN